MATDTRLATLADALLDTAVQALTGEVGPSGASLTPARTLVAAGPGWARDVTSMCVVEYGPVRLQAIDDMGGLPGKVPSVPVADFTVTLTRPHPTGDGQTPSSASITTASNDLAVAALTMWAGLRTAARARVFGVDAPHIGDLAPAGPAGAAAEWAVTVTAVL